MIQDTLSDIYQCVLLQTILKTISRETSDYIIFHLDTFENTATRNLFLILSSFLQVGFLVIGFLFFLFTLYCRLCLSEAERNWYWVVLRMHCSYQGSGFPSNSNHMKFDRISSSGSVSCLLLCRRSRSVWAAQVISLLTLLFEADKVIFLCLLNKDNFG